MAKKLFIGMRPEYQSDRDAKQRAERFCRVANEQVIPLLKEYDIEPTKDAICSAVANRNWITEFVASRTLNSEEYKTQPDLLKRAVEKVLTDEVTAKIADYGESIETDASYCSFSDKEVFVDEELLTKRREVWLTTETQISAYNDYKAVVDALNRLFYNNPSPNSIAAAFDMSYTGGKPLRVNPALFMSHFGKR